MSVTLQGSGTQTATIGTEHTLLDIAVDGVFEFDFDPVLLADLEIVELRCYTIVLTGGTRRVKHFARFTGALPTDDMIQTFVPVVNELTDSGSVRFTLKQLNGTGRNFPWKVMKL